MKALTSFTCILIFIGVPRIWGQTYSESIESLRFEVTNLQEQIVFVIQNADLNLRDSDKALEAQKARIRSLEKKNNELKRQPMSGKKATNARYEREIAKLKTENKNLWEELEKGRVGTSQHTHNLVAKNKKLEEALEKSLLEKEKLRSQIESMRSFAAQHQEAIQSSMTETYAENQRLVAEVESLKDQLNANTSYVGSNIAEREKMMAETARYKAKYDSLLFSQRQSITAVKASNRSNTNEILTIDSLEYENAELKSLISGLMNTGSVDKSRVEGIDLREQRLELERNRIAIREQMVEAREKDVEFKVQELTVKEAKYNNLEEKEKQLKLLEQKLREMIESEGDSR